MARETIQEFKDILYKIENKIDRNTETINDIKIEMNRINHDLYGNGRIGLFEEQYKLKEIVYKNYRYIGGVIAVISFITFFPMFREFIKLIMK
jgi:hypothetical protein